MGEEAEHGLIVTIVGLVVVYFGTVVQVNVFNVQKKDLGAVICNSYSIALKELRSFVVD